MSTDRRSSFLYLVLLAALLFVACDSFPSSTSTPILIPLDTPRPSTPTATSPPTSTPHPTKTRRPTSTPTHGPFASSTTPPVPAPPGLIYRNKDGLLVRIGADGIPIVLFDRPAVLFSADGTRVIFDRERDLWLADLTTGQESNLTGTPDRIEGGAIWWPARPDILLFGSFSEETCCWGVGSLSSVWLDGTGFQVLDQEVSHGPFAPSPDGQTIAYDRAGTPWLYHWGAGPVPLRPEEFGLSGLSETFFVRPAWSPHGNYLAWVVLNLPTGEFSIVVFDLELKMVRLLGSYTPLGFDGIIPGPVWSPDGRWLSFFAPAQDDNERGVWVVESNGLEEHSICADCNWSSGVWSPDGRSLAYLSKTGQVWLTEVGTWSSHPVKLAAGVELVSWIEVK